MGDQLYDVDAERALIGAVLEGGTLAASALNAAIESGLEPAMFHGSTDNGRIYASILEVHALGDAVDAVTVAPHLPDDVRSKVGGAVGLMTDFNGFTSSVPTYARTIVEHWRNRWIKSQLEQANNGQFPNWREIIDNIAETVDGWTNTGSDSLESDLALWLAGDIEPVNPQLIPRDDGATMLLYRPGTTWLSGESGKGKTLIAQWWVLHEIIEGRHVIYIDHEGTEQSLLARLQDMGAPHDKIISHLHYMNRVGEMWTPAAMTMLRTTIAAIHPSLVVIDAVAGAMEAELPPLNPEYNPDIERWNAGLPSYIKAQGAAVVCIDHVNKDPEKRNGYATGGWRKRAVADCAYELDMAVDAGIGTTGTGKLIVNKDRHGALAGHQAGKTIAAVAIESVADGEGGHLLTIALTKPAGAGIVKADKPRGWVPTWYMEQVSRVVEDHTDEGGIGKSDIRTLVGGTVKHTDRAILLLVESDHIKIADVKGAAKPYVSLVKYRQPVEDEHQPVDDPTQDRY